MGMAGKAMVVWMEREGGGKETSDTQELGEEVALNRLLKDMPALKDRVVGLASRSVQCEQRYLPLFQRILRRVVLVNKLDTAQELLTSAMSPYTTTANFPFEIIAGDHDTDNIDRYAVDLPDHLGHLTGTYAKEYAFDYPAGTPLARFILLSPSNVIPGYLYNKGGSHYNWVAQQIDGARNAHIRWVIVAMHEYCFTIGSLGCPASDLLNLLISKKVDLILQGHKHDYQSSKQLAFNGTTCTALSTTYNSHCVVNATKSLMKGAGSVIVVTGTGGITPLLSIDTTDPRMGYFRSWMAANINQTWGVSQFTVTASQLTMKFVGTSGGTFTDNFMIHV